MTEAAATGPQIYPLKTVASSTGLTPDLVRAWERRYGVAQPLRGPRGARLYSAAEIARLQLLARAVQQGFAIGDVARLDPTELSKLLQEHGDQREGGLAPSADPRAVPLRDNPIGSILDALRLFDAPRARQLLSEALIARGGQRFAMDVAAPLLIKVGQEWHEGRLTIASEHLCTSIMKDLVSSLIASHVPAGQPRILLAAPGGERHEVGLLLVALLATYRGVSPVNLGGDLPVDEIVQAARAARVRVLGLAAVDSGNRPQTVASLRHLLRELPRETKLWLGGNDASAVAAEVAEERVVLLDRLDAVDVELQRLALASRPPTTDSI